MTPHGGHGVHEAHASHRGHGSNGHDKHAGHSVAMFRDTFWVSPLLTLPALAWGHMLQRAFSYHAPVLAAFAVADMVRPESALVTANAGIAIGAGTDVAVEAGDVVLVRSDPRDVLRVIELSRAASPRVTRCTG